MIRLLFLLLCLPVLGEDYPEMSDGEAFKLAQNVLKNHSGPYNERSIKRIGNKTILFDSFVSMEADTKLFPAILNDIQNYSQWALKNINTRPNGGNYYIKVLDLKPEPGNTHALRNFISVDLPLFKHNLQALVKIYPEETPNVYTVKMEMAPDERSILVGAKAIMKAFPAENRQNYKWIFVRAQVLLRHWLLYEALPDKLLKKESGERVQIVLDNYADEEERRKKRIK